jgi:hypothetical protein
MFNSRAPNRQIKASGQMKIKTYSRRQNLKGKIIQLNQMIRIIFWIFVALFLAAFFWGASASKNWTEQENAQFSVWLQAFFSSHLVFHIFSILNIGNKKGVHRWTPL